MKPAILVQVWRLNDYSKPVVEKVYRSWVAAERFAKKWGDKGYDPEISWNGAAAKLLQKTTKK